MAALVTIVPALPHLPGVSVVDAADEPPRPTLLCDATGCLLASPWLLDSDGDGATDADERAAGTDPHDPDSRPRLSELVQLAFHGELPSFATTLGRFAVLPDAAVLAETFGANPETAVDLASTGAFAMPTRADTLTRLGLTSELAAKATDSRLGLIVGLTEPTKQGEPPVGGHAGYLQLVASEDGGVKVHKDETRLSNGDVILRTETKGDGGTWTTTEVQKTKDGDTVRVTTCNGTTCTSERTDPDQTDYDVPQLIVVADGSDQVIRRLGSATTPARLPGVEIDPASVDEVVAEQCGGSVATTAVETKEGGGGASDDSFSCEGVIWVDPEQLQVEIGAPDLSNVPSPRQVEGWEPPTTSDPGRQPGSNSAPLRAGVVPWPI